MNKIKISLVKKENKKVKFNKQIIEVIPYIDMKNAIILNDMVSNNYFKDYEDKELDKHAFTTQINNAYLLGVLELCTNVDIYEDIPQEELDDLEVAVTKYSDIEISRGTTTIDIDNILATDLPQIVESNITNYKEVLETIKFGIAQKNMEGIFEIFGKEIANAIPTSEGEAKALKDASKLLDDMLKDGRMEKVFETNFKEIGTAMGVDMSQTKTTKPKLKAKA